MCIRDRIVCGAPNVAAGQKVMVATIGTQLFNAEGEAFTIKKGKIRGAESQGMICAEDEPVSYTHLRAHETVLDLVCRLLLEKKKKKKKEEEIISVIPDPIDSDISNTAHNTV